MRQGHRLCWLALSAFLLTPAFAAEAERNVVRFGLFYAEPTGVSTYPRYQEFGPPSFPYGTIVLDYRERLDVGSAVGLEVEYERRFGKRLGVTLSLSQAEHELHGAFAGGGTYTPDFGYPEPGAVTGSLRGDIRVTPLIVGLNIHFETSGDADVYFGPLIAYVDYGGTKIRDGAVRAEFSSGYVLVTFVPETVGVKNDLGLGANLGMDIPLGRRHWTFSMGIRYFRTEIRFDVPGGRTIDLMPWQARLGFGRRF